MKSRHKSDGRVVILSPHLDDAVLSCGGLISALQNEIGVEIWTIFSGAPTIGPYSSTARWLHNMSGGSTGSRLAWRRRREDREATRLLGAHHHHFKWHDAVYRRGPDGQFLYSETRLPQWHKADEPLLREIANNLRDRLSKQDVLLIPLGIGEHVDHLIVRRAGEELRHTQYLYYADVPYVDACADDLRVMTQSLHDVRFEIDPTDLTAWSDGIHCYRTQISMLENFFGDLTSLIKRVRDSGLRLYSERDATLPAFNVFFFRPQ